MQSAVSGIVLLDKPSGISSYDAVERVKRMLPGVKVGHSGTLDPMASGLLVAGVGSQTKRLADFQKLPKSYIAEIKLGEITDTDDAEGEIIGATDIPDDAQARVLAMIGKQMQMPPAYSAKHINGQRAYKLAREGKKVELKESEIEIYDIRILEWSEPVLKIEVVCGAGTYIRSIARDLGGHLIGLRRTSIGDFNIDDAYSLDELNCLVFKFEPSIVSFGKFDGLHAGHKEVILAQAQLARELNMPSLAIILDNGEDYLMRPSERSKEILSMGIDQTIIQPMNDAFKNVSAENFLNLAFAGSKFVLGQGQKFGKDAKGSIKMIPDALEVPSIEGVSSSALKAEIADGEFAHPYAIIGKVVHGFNRGAKLGVPTANLDAGRYIVPKDGVYACQVLLNRKKYPAVVSVGFNSTFDAKERTIEIHILDFNKDLYSKTLGLVFIERLRDMQTFASPAELVAQINSDIARTVTLLAD